MNPMSALLLTPLLLADGDVRLVSDGTGDVPVTWILDGSVVAETYDGQPAGLHITSGEHELWAYTDYPGPWTAMARLDPHKAGQAAYVEPWHASSPGHELPQPNEPDWRLPIAAAAVAAGLVLWPKQPSTKAQSKQRGD